MQAQSIRTAARYVDDCFIFLIFLNERNKALRLDMSDLPSTEAIVCSASSRVAADELGPLRCTSTRSVSILLSVIAHRGSFEPKASACMCSKRFKSCVASRNLWLVELNIEKCRVRTAQMTRLTCSALSLWPLISVTTTR